MSQEPLSRAGANESLFRQINEAIERGQWPGEEDAKAGFRCECARLGCNDIIMLSVTEYEQVRANARRFVVADGHEVTAAETVVERRGGYTVVEKRGEAATLAEATDPRR